jgi:hypothetical protein
LAGNFIAGMNCHQYPEKGPTKIKKIKKIETETETETEG